MNMYLYEIKSLRKSTIIWTLSILALALIYFSVYPGVANDAADFKKLIGGYPPSVRALLGISLDTVTQILGFYSMIFSFIMVCAAIQSMNYGVSILSKEVRERTADFLLVKPVSRSKIVTAKLLAVLTMLILTNIVYSAGASILANIVKTSDFSEKLFLMINATIFFVQLIFMSIGVVVSVILPKVKSVLPVSLAITFGFYIIGALIVTDQNDWTRFLFPFKYFDNAYIIRNAGYESQYLITSAVIVIVTVIASYIIYKKKDIHAVS